MGLVVEIALQGKYIPIAITNMITGDGMDIFFSTANSLASF